MCLDYDAVGSGEVEDGWPQSVVYKMPTMGVEGNIHWCDIDAQYMYGL